jgi:hypothetical protein
MPPRFTPNMADVTTTVPIIDDGDAVFEINQPKLFARKNAKDEEVYGVQLGLLIKQAPNHVGKTIPQQLYLHTEASLPMTKRFVMAALGYDPNDETVAEAFNAKYPSEMWVCDWDNNVIGEVFNRLAGQNIAASVTHGLTKPQDGSEPRNQNRFNWKPIA